MWPVDAQVLVRHQAAPSMADHGWCEKLTVVRCPSRMANGRVISKPHFVEAVALAVVVARVSSQAALGLDVWRDQRAELGVAA